MSDEMRRLITLAESVNAWHGTAKSFRKFSARYVGTGQGQSKYGWGFYFTSDEDVGARYAVLARGGSESSQVGFNRLVSIPDPADFLDWDVPISSQPRPLQQALTLAFPEENREQFAALVGYDWRGLDGYKWLSKVLGSKKAASLALNKQGIFGIKYFGQDDLDGRGTRNVVVFDSSKLRIVRQ